MQRTVLGILLATVVAYLWGMLYWGANPLPYTAWKTSADDVAAGRALLDHFPEEGTYHLPALHHDDATLAALYETGPVAFVHMTSRQGRPQLDPKILIRGLVLTLVMVTLLAMILQLALPALPSYLDRLKLVALAGLLAAVAVDLGDHVWWNIPLEWKLHQALYSWTAWLVPGIVLARFIRPEPAEA